MQPARRSATPRVRMRLAAVAPVVVALVAVAGPTGAAPTAAAVLTAGPAPGETALVAVDVTDPGQANLLIERGLDVITIGTVPVEVMLHSAWDAEVLASTDLPTRVLVEDLGAVNAASRRSESRAAAAADEDAALASDLPTGRLEYRTADETDAEIRAMAAAHPDTVALVELPHPSLLGRTVLGAEISHDVDTDPGKPVFLNTGVHHAREWPTVEFVMEFAWEVLEADGTDPRITDLLERGRMIVVPMVNPDGYDISRSRVLEQKRKNCRVTPGQVPTAEACAAAANAGVDPNRNYGAFWGGPGQSGNPNASNYRGEAPFSEPEIRNMRAVAAGHQVTVAINNHTPDERLLRAPSSSNEPVPADEAAYDALAQALGADLGWPAGPWTEIYYEASGTAEQTAYYGAGTFGFTPEATPGFGGADRFHPPYEFVVDQYLGEDRYEGSSMRAAYLTAWEAAVDPARHGVITGTARPGARLTATKTFTLDSSALPSPDGGTPVVLPAEQQLSTTITVPRDGRVEWHVNPSLRPSQYLTAYIREAWTITCPRGRNRVAAEVDVVVPRGGTAQVDLSDCQGRPPRAPGRT